MLLHELFPSMNPRLPETWNVLGDALEDLCLYHRYLQTSLAACRQMAGSEELRRSLSWAWDTCLRKRVSYGVTWMVSHVAVPEAARVGALTPTSGGLGRSLNVVLGRMPILVTFRRNRERELHDNPDHGSLVLLTHTPGEKDVTHVHIHGPGVMDVDVWQVRQTMFIEDMV